MAVFAAMKPAILSILAALLTGCVTIPVPPVGESRGALGDLKVSVTVQYLPRVQNQTPASTSQSHAWEQFLKSQPKTLKDK
jgi:starvation-inducible outer membrane lipoprotein